jgi:radical SAM protein with 4Fe4S-binding SPASM domain
VFWETTARCNLRCVHCRRLDTPTRPDQTDLGTVEAMELINDLAAHHDGAILVFSGGEPLLRHDTLELASHAARHGLATALATNGTLVTPQAAGEIRAAGFSVVSVSLDGARAETHDAIRGLPGSFDKALAGLRHLRDAGQRVQINMSITRSSAVELEAMFALAEAEGVAALHVFIVVPVGCGRELDEADRLSPEEYERFLRRFLELSAGAKFGTKATCAPQYARITDQLQSESPGPGAGCPTVEAGRRGCLAGSGVCFVSHAGLVYPCGYLPVECGSVRYAPLSQIWRDSPVFARLRQVELLAGKCGECDWRVACGGCRARAFAATGDYLAEEPDCIYKPK